MKRTGNSEKRNVAESVGYIGNSETNRKLEESGMVRWKGCCVHVARNTEAAVAYSPRHQRLQRVRTVVRQRVLVRFFDVPIWVSDSLAVAVYAGVYSGA